MYTQSNYKLGQATVTSSNVQISNQSWLQSILDEVNQISKTHAVRDENKLTNLLFFIRYPKRKGRRISRNEPNYKQLSKEWVDIRDRLVRPFLNKLSSYQQSIQTSLPSTLTFTPISVETPGGGRIKNKRDPNSKDIVYVKGVGDRKIPLHRLAASAWEALVKSARADGIQHPLLLSTSGYRSSKRQAELWKEALQKYGSEKEARKWVAKPGHSAHQSGRAIDFYLGGRNTSKNVANLRRLPAYQWLAKNAKKFGFYPYEREPWHWEYNPPAQ